MMMISSGLTGDRISSIWVCDSLKLSGMNFLWFFVFSSWSITVAQDSFVQTHGQIIHSSVVFRHGHRTPGVLFPKLKYADKDWNEGIGQLNKDGKQLMYRFGKWLRGRYEGTELNLGYRYDRVRVDSSDKERTLESAELVLAGLFPPQGNEIWDDVDGLKWQPIAVHTKPTNVDELISQTAKCTKYDRQHAEISDSDDMKNYYEQNEQLFANLASNAGLDLTDETTLMKVVNISFILDTILILKAYGMDIPSWANDVSEEMLDPIVTKIVTNWVATDDMKRLKVGPLFASFVSDIKAKMAGNSQFLHLYSGHDATIASILVALGSYQRLIPYGAAFIVELRELCEEKEKKHYVTMLYWEKPDADPRPILLSGCGEYCTLENFLELIDPLVPKNWQEECGIE